MRKFGRLFFYKKFLTLVVKQGDDCSNKHCKTNEFCKSYVHVTSPPYRNKERTVHRVSGTLLYKLVYHSAQEKQDKNVK